MREFDDVARSVNAPVGRLLAVCLTILATPPVANAADCAPCHEWMLISPSQGAPTTFASAGEWLVHAIGGDVQVQSKTNGYLLATYHTSGIERAPATTDLGGGEAHWYAFVTSTDGYLRKLDLAAPLPSTLPLATTYDTPQLRNMRRGACPSDSLIAEPVVQRVADSNAGFTLAKDIVMVATAHGCGDTTGNQVVALDASDITKPALWTFNSGEFEIDRIHSCLLDLARNRLVCNMQVPTAGYALAVVSIDTNDGQPAWGVASDAGVHARVALGRSDAANGDRVYVGDQHGHVRAFDAGDGTETGDIAVVASGTIDIDLAAADGLYAGLTLAAGSDGSVSAIYDAGDELIVAWTSAGYYEARSEPIPAAQLGKAYAIFSDGYLHQLDLSSGSDEARGPIGMVTGGQSAGSALSAYVGDDGGWRVVGSFDDANSGTRSSQYRIPCKFGTTLCVPDVTIFSSGFEIA